MRLSIRCVPWRGFIMTHTAPLIVLSTHTTHPKSHTYPVHVLSSLNYSYGTYNMSQHCCNFIQNCLQAAGKSMCKSKVITNVLYSHSQLSTLVFCFSPIANFKTT